jgi:6-phosphogluconolactonase
MTDDVDVLVLDDAEGAAARVADLLAEAAARGDEIVLTGGSTPARAYELAAERQRDWHSAGVWWGDERCVPPHDERSNFGLARDTLLERVDVGPRAVHRIRGELEPKVAAEEYEHELDGVALDLLLLGIGPDGHVASLFPNEPTLEEQRRRVIPARAKLEPFVERVTLTLPVLNAARHVVFLVSGEQKSDAVARAFAAPPSPATPSSLVRGVETTTAVLDRAAATRLRL